MAGARVSCTRYHSLGSIATLEDRRRVSRYPLSITLTYICVYTMSDNQRASMYSGDNYRKEKQIPHKISEVRHTL